jgi:hypothetical protein
MLSTEGMVTLRPRLAGRLPGISAAGVEGLGADPVSVPELVASNRALSEALLAASQALSANQALQLAPSSATLSLSEAEEAAFGRGGLQAVRELRAAGQVGVRLQIIIEGNTGAVEAARRRIREGLRSPVDEWKQQEESLPGESLPG